MALSRYASTITPRTYSVRDEATLIPGADAVMVTPNVNGYGWTAVAVFTGRPAIEAGLVVGLPTRDLAVYALVSKVQDIAEVDSFDAHAAATGGQDENMNRTKHSSSDECYRCRKCGGHSRTAELLDVHEDECGAWRREDLPRPSYVEALARTQARGRTVQA